MTDLRVVPVFEQSPPEYLDVTDFIERLRPAFWSQGKCRDYPHSWFFPERGAQADSQAAKAVCAECPVRAECLNYALENCERFGVWGGKSEKQRRRMRIARRAS